MITAGLHLAATVGLLVGCGYLPARVLVSNGPWAAALAPLVAAMGCAVGAMASVVTGAPLAFCVGPTLLVASAASGFWISRRPPETGVAPSWRSLLVLVAVVAVPLLGVQRAPVDWDAGSIWFLHADWFFVGGKEAVAAFSDPSYAFSHPDYPPLAPATVAAVWTLLGRDHELAQLVISVLGGSAVLAIAMALRGAAARLHSPGRGIAEALLVLAAYGLAGTGATNGYADLLWSATFVAGTIGLLAGRPERAATAAAAMCLAVAMLTKNEGMAAGAVVLVLVVVTRGWRRGLPVACASAAPAAAWVLTARALGAEGDLTTQGRFSGLVGLEPEVLDRMAPTALALWQWCRWELLAAAVLTAVGVAVARRTRLHTLGAGSLGIWAAAGGCLASIGFAYVISPNEITWHLRTSVDRTTLAPRLLLVSEVTVWILVLAHWWRDVPRASTPLASSELEEGVSAGNGALGTGPPASGSDFPDRLAQQLDLEGEPCQLRRSHRLPPPPRAG